MPIRTARLTLREFVRSDFDAVHAYSSDPRVTQYLVLRPARRGQHGRISGRTCSPRKREVPRTRFELAVQETRSGRVIGACDLSLIERNVVDLGYMLGNRANGARAMRPKFRWRSSMPHFSICAPIAIISTVDVNNRASIRVLEKIGMRWEAVYRKHRRAKNRWWDCHLFVLPREVWELRAGRAPTSCRDRARRILLVLRRLLARALASRDQHVLAGHAPALRVLRRT